MKDAIQKQATKKERLNARNKNVRDCFYSTQEKHPKYKIEYIIQEVAQKFYLSSRTVNAILSHEGIYKD